MMMVFGCVFIVCAIPLALTIAGASRLLHDNRRTLACLLGLVAIVLLGVLGTRFGRAHPRAHPTCPFLTPVLGPPTAPTTTLSTAWGFPETRIQNSA